MQPVHPSTRAGEKRLVGKKKQKAIPKPSPSSLPISIGSPPPLLPSSPISFPALMEGGDGSTPSMDLFLHGLGKVALAVDHEGLSWEPSPSEAADWRTRCLRYNLSSDIETAVKFSDIYAVELFQGGPIQESTTWLRGLTFDRHPRPELHHFVVYGFRRSRAQRCLWVPSAYIFGHEELATCHKWIQKIQDNLNKQGGRPKNLLVFVHPLSGKGKGWRTWESVRPIFSRANVKTKVMVTQRAGHAFDLTTSITDDDLISFDGIVVVGGDGFFNEVLNGLLLSRHKTTTLNSPGFFFSRNDAPIEQLSANSRTEDNSFTDDGHVHISTDGREDDPLLQNSRCMMPSHANISKQVTSAEAVSDHHSVLSFPNDHFRLGLIPAGSTDSIVISTTGARNAVTSALHIVLGKRICLDIAQVVRWETCNTSNHGPSVRYAASFAGYGFYGDVVKESEKYRWMGPRRYDYAGTKVFMRHSSYDADVSFLQVENSNDLPENGSSRTEPNEKQSSLKNPSKNICRVNCNVCNEPNMPSQVSDADDNASSSCTLPENSRWVQTKGRFHCIGAAVISCRNDRAPDGLVVDAHLGDGFMHLILIKECPRPLYLWHLTKLTRRGSNPLDFKFVEHHRTPAFTFATSSNESIWNLDGELFQACQLSAQVFRGLVNLFAAGPEV